ncbi:DUF6545 domain-containing protein [Streptomyces sp. 4N124]|uniref:DUF6545 domain-containing protein n=1 Tax=Streptomyces sp. 4N124 TaxID=3457420 RepID=UPI003FD0A371
MWQDALTGINLTIAVITLILGVTKAVAARSESGPTLKLTASVLLHAGLIFLLATPPIYRDTGRILHSANLPALAIDVATLLCVGHAHYMTLLWHPERHTEEQRRRAVRAWLPFYAGAITLMIALYAYADLSGAAPPLHFGPYYAEVTAVFALKIIYFGALIVAVVATMILCTQAALPNRPDLAKDVRRCMVWFGIAVGLDLATAVFTLTAMTSVLVRGDHHLDYLADASWVATILSGIAANQSLGRLVLATTRSDRRDIRTIKPLWEMVVGDARHLVIATSWRQDSRIKLDRIMIETLDGIRILKPWMTTSSGSAVEDVLNDDRRRQKAEQHRDRKRWRRAREAGADVDAARTAALLRHAALRRSRNEPPVPEADRPEKLPGVDVPESQQQAYLVGVARHLDHAIVTEAIEQAEMRRALSDPAAT